VRRGPAGHGLLGRLVAYLDVRLRLALCEGGGETMSMNIELTTESAMSIYGQPVLRIRTADG
jgi:hypothetical protein